jgi:hypothetical protein
MALTTETDNGYKNGLSNELMRVSGETSQATYTASCFSDKVPDVIRINFLDPFRGNFRTAYDPTRTNLDESLDEQRGFREEIFLEATSQGNYDILKHFRVKQIDGLTGNVVAEGIPLRWVPPSADGRGGTLFIKVLYQDLPNPTTFNQANGVIYCDAIDQFTYGGKTYSGNPISVGTTIKSIQTVSNVYKLTSVEAYNSAPSTLPCAGGTESVITLGKGIYQSGQRVVLKELLAANGSPCTSSFSGTGVVISSTIDTLSQKVSVFVEFDQPLNDTAGENGNCSNCTNASERLVLCTGDASGSCLSSCCIYSIDNVRKISTPECGTVQKIYFSDEIAETGEFVPGRELYQWKYENCGNHPGNAAFYTTKQADAQSKIVGEYLNWDTATKVLYVLCPNSIMQIKYGNVYQLTETGTLLSRGSGISPTSKFERRTGSFVNLRNTTETPTYISGREYQQVWDSTSGGELLVQTLTSTSTSYNTNYEYVIGETVLQALTEDFDGNVVGYAAGTVVDWQPNTTALDSVPSILTIKRKKIGTENPLFIDTNDPLIPATTELARFRFGTNLAPTTTGTLLKNTKRNILPLRVFETVNTTGNIATDWYDFSSENVVQNSTTTELTDTVVIASIGTIAKGSSIGSTRIKAIKLNAGNVYDISLMNTNIFYNEPVSFKDVTQIGKSNILTNTTGVSYSSIEPVIEVQQDYISGEYVTRIFNPTSDKQIIPLPAGDVIENVTSGSGNFGSTLLTIQQIFDVNFPSNSAEVFIEGNINGAEFPSTFSTTYSFAVDQLGNSLNLVKYNNLAGSPAAEPSDNNTLYYDVIVADDANVGIKFKKKSTSSITSIIFGSEVKCSASNVIKEKRQKTFNATTYLTYNTSGPFKNKWTAIIPIANAIDVYKLNSVFGVSGTSSLTIITNNVKDWFGISKETDDYLYKPSILVLNGNGVTTNTNTDPNQGPITPTVPTFGLFEREGLTENYRVKIRVNGLGYEGPTGGGIVVRESYKDTNGNLLSVKNIPYYVSKVDGEQYHSTAFIDCRGTLDDDIVFNKFVILPQSSTINTTLGVYAPRYDILYINKNGSFKVAYGTASFTPSYPELPEDGMILYKIKKPSYVFDNQALTLQYTDNRRYTMRDIGKLEKRVQQLEVYSALSLLEKDADSLLVEDVNGNNRFKNGIIVDPFENHKIGEVSHVDYNVAVDPTETCLRPKAQTENLKLSYVTPTESAKFIEVLNTKTGVTGNVSNPSISTGLFMLPFTETAFVVQPQATRAMSVTPFETLNLEGTVRLSPREDDWVDTETRPDLNVNLAGENDIWEDILDELNSSEDGPFALNFGNWSELSRQTTSNRTTNTTRRGRRRTTTRTTTTNSTIREERNITGEQLRTGTEQVSLGDRVVDVSFIPYMRGRRIKIVITGLKTNARLYPFFDGVDVSQYCYLYNTLGALDTDLAQVSLTEANKFTNTSSGFKKSSAQGNAFIIFDMPTGTFRTGDRKFTISDNQNNDFSRATTFATGTYSASGLSQVRETTKATIRTFETETINITEERVRSETAVNVQTTTVRVDPLAQTFTINPELYPNGIFLSSIDVFFARKPDNSTNIPVKVEVRPTVNAFPDAYKIYPGGISILHPSQVNVSDTPSANNSATATRFNFETPVYLEPGEHCFIVRSTTDEYEIYVAEIGQTLVNSTQRVTEQPYVGVFFSSSNATTWLPQPAMDMMMVLNKCEFTPNQTYTFACKTNVAGKDVKYELLNLNNAYQEFDVSRLFWRISDNNTLNGTYSPINANENVKYTSTKTLLDGESLYFKATALTTSKDVCPILNTERMSAFLVKNLIENNSSTQTNGELNPYANDFGDIKRTRYITKIVTLEEGFESTGFKLILSVNKPVGTKIKAFLKYQPAEQTKTFHENPYVELVPDMGSSAFDNFFTRTEEEYVDVQFALPVDSSSPYNKFAIKLCLFSDNPAFVPKIQDLRGIAVL